jgi:hypothetical protein
MSKTSFFERHPGMLLVPVFLVSMDAVLCIKQRVNVPCMCCRSEDCDADVAYMSVVHENWDFEGTLVYHARVHVGITGIEFHTMAPARWVSDAVINLYIALLQVC